MFLRADCANADFITAALLHAMQSCVRMPLGRVFLLALLILASLASPAFAAPASSPVQLDADEIKITTALRYVEDAQHKHTLDSIARDDVAWLDNDTHAFNRGYSNSDWWLTFRVHNPSTAHSERLLEVSYAALDYLDIYIVDNQQLRDQFKLGDKLPQHQRPIDHRFFVVPINIDAQQTLTIYLRVRSSGAVQAPLTLWERQHFYSADSTSTILQGIYYGGMATIALYNLLIFFVLRERNYLYYVGFMLSVPIALGSQSGQAFRYLWPNATQWNDLAIAFFMATAGMCAAAFSRRFLEMQNLSRTLARLLDGATSLCLALALLTFVLPYHVTIQMLMPMILVTCVLALVCGGYAMKRHQSSARIYMLAWFFFLLGAVVVSLNRLTILPANTFTEYSAQFGSLLEAVMLSLALAQRINTERRLRFEAQSETLHASQRANAELEQRVHERTAELEALNTRLRELSDTDQLTGLKNRRFLEQRLRAEWTRARRYQESLAVVMLDIDFFKLINDEHGHLAGDAVLQEVAKHIGAGLRWPSDLAARYGGEEFCLVLAQTDAQGAMTVAERVRARVETHAITVAGVCLSVTVSGGVFAAIPAEHLDIETFLRNADMALYQSKQHGRNRVSASTHSQTATQHPLPPV